MKSFFKRCYKNNFIFILYFLLIFCGVKSNLIAENIIRNSDFESSISDWNFNPEITEDTSDMYSYGEISLHPSSNYGFKGVVIYQNLNITNISNKELNVTLVLNPVSLPSANNEKTISVYIVFLKNDRTTQRVKIAQPLNATILQNLNNGVATIKSTYTFPQDALKLTKVEIAKEDYGDILLDSITINMDGVMIGKIPKIISISPKNISYGEILTIEGENLDNNISLGKILNVGVTPINWSNTEINATVGEPAKNGLIILSYDGVQSDISQNADINITSPNFTIKSTIKSKTVFKGQKVSFPILVEFHNGFTTPNGVGFFLMSDNDSSNTAFADAKFEQAPIKNSGGVLLSIDTSTLSPGTYHLTAQSLEDNSYARFAYFTLIVKDISSVSFVDSADNPINDLTVEKQGLVENVGLIAMDENGKKIYNIYFNGIIKDINSSDPENLVVYDKSRYFVNNDTSANIIVSLINGKTATLHIDAILSKDRPTFTSMTLSNPIITNSKYVYEELNATLDTKDKNLFVMSGYENINEINENPTWTSDRTFFHDTFEINGSASDVGEYLLYVAAGTSQYSSDCKMVKILKIINDPLYSTLKGTVGIVDPTIKPYMAEFFKISFYNPQDNSLTYTKDVFAYAQEGPINYKLYGIIPGTYKIKITPYDDTMETFKTQWYPNAYSIDKAKPVTFKAGESIENINFFLTKKVYDNVADNNTTNPTPLHQEILTLKNGWNLVSLPVNKELNQTQIIEKFSTSGIIWKYDPTAKSWKVISPNGDFSQAIDQEPLQNISNIGPAEGIWIKNTQDDNVTFDGDVYSLSSYLETLQTGWNLVGTGEDIPTQNILNTKPDITYIWVWRDGEWYGKTTVEGKQSIINSHYNELNSIKSKEGAWIKLF